MPDGKPTMAPLIIFGTMVTMSIISVGVVFYFHSQRTEPYLDTKMRRVKKVRKPKPAATPSAPAPVVAPTPAIDAAVATDAGR